MAESLSVVQSVSSESGFCNFESFFFSDDLWASLSHASSKPVADVMETWTKQMGFPVLSVTAEQV